MVFLGAGIGGVARYGIGRLLPTSGAGVPWSTLIVNVSGSLLITLFAAIAQQKGMSTQTHAFLTIGLCGGYTTFSALSAESLTMIQGGHWGRAAWYALASVVLCLLASVAGLRLGAAYGSA
jgi:CrcB protein